MTPTKRVEGVKSARTPAARHRNAPAASPVAHDPASRASAMLLVEDRLHREGAWREWFHAMAGRFDRLKSGDVEVRLPKMGPFRELAKAFTKEEAVSALALEPDFFEDEALRLSVFRLRCLLMERLKGLPGGDEAVLGFFTTQSALVHTWMESDQLGGIARHVGIDREVLFDWVLSELDHEHPWRNRVGVVFCLSVFVDDEYARRALEAMLSEAVRTKAAVHYYLSMSLAWALTSFVQHDEALTLSVLDANPLDDTTAKRFVRKVCESFRSDDVQKARLKAWLGEG